MNGEAAKRGKGMWVLQPCVWCDGRGSWGTASGYRILCEMCENSRLGWTERCYIGKLGEE
jgi:hypothetical protein